MFFIDLISQHLEMTYLRPNSNFVSKHSNWSNYKDNQWLVEVILLFTTIHNRKVQGIYSEILLQS